jgi:hypothetical protein
MMILKTEELTGLFEELLELSKRQREALDRQAFRDIEKLLEAKEKALRSAGELLNQLSEMGVAVMNPQTYPDDPELRARLSRAATQVRRFQAHEKYVTAQVNNLQGDVSQLLHSLRRRRTSLAGYATRPTGKHLLSAIG